MPAIVDDYLLAPFYRRLAALIRGRTKRPVRIAVYGDSNLTMDFITGQMRRTLQQRYGDAGHGFVALGRPWSHYRHMDVKHDIKSGFDSYVVTTHPTGDGAYGLSGIAAISLWPGASTWVATADPRCPVGRTASRFDVFYWRRPKAGKFEILIDDQRQAVIDTAAPERGLGYFRADVEDAAHTVRFVALTPVRVRLFGVALERRRAGVVVDSFGVGSLNSRAHAKQDPQINREMLRHRNYDLVLFMTGANDVSTMDVAPGYMKQVIELHRSALPRIALLVVSPADRGKKRSYKPTLKVIEQRKQIAKDNRCAFWNLWEAMGGLGSMARFRRRGLCRSDGEHFNQAGGAYVGNRLVYALLRGLQQYASTHGQVGCQPASEQPLESASLR